MNKINILLFILLGVISLQVQAQGIKITQPTKMTIDNGTQIKIINGGNFLMKADASGSASLVDRNMTNQINFSGGGESKMELYLTADNWHYISSPVSSALSSVFMNIYLMQFDETDSSWFYIVATDSVIHPMQGYACWAASSLTGTTTVTYAGTLNCGLLSTNLTNHGSASHNSKGFNFVGNPYPSAINWQLGNTAWTRTNIDPTVYLYNPSIGQYGNYNRNTKIGNNGVDSIIAPKQGFFVHVTTSGTGTLGVNNNARLHTNKVMMKSSATIYDNLLYVKVSGDNNYSDETQIFFDENTSSGFDYEFDAVKLFGKMEAPQLFTGLMNEGIYSVNGLPSVSNDLVIPMGFVCGEAENYTLDFSYGLELGGNLDIFLEDKKKSQVQNIKENHLYTFSSSSSDEPNRFAIHFKNPQSVEEQEFNEFFMLNIVGHLMTVSYSGNEKAYAKIVDLTGRGLSQKKLVTGNNQFNLNEATSWYLLSIQMGTRNFTKKFFVK